jgi:hypothetical protein
MDSLIKFSKDAVPATFIYAKPTNGKSQVALQLSMITSHGGNLYDKNMPREIDKPAVTINLTERE